MYHNVLSIPFQNLVDFILHIQRVGHPMLKNIFRCLTITPVRVTRDQAEWRDELYILIAQFTLSRVVITKFNQHNTIFFGLITEQLRSLASAVYAFGDTQICTLYMIFHFLSTTLEEMRTMKIFFYSLEF